MRAMVLDKPSRPLQLRDVSKPKPDRGQLLVRVATCAMCRTDLHVVDGELPDPKLPLILGHQIVGRVEEIPEGANSKFQIGDRVGIPWLGWTDGECVYCRSNRENLCDRARFTGYTIDGGYAEFAVADSRFCFHLPDGYNDADVVLTRPGEKATQESAKKLGAKWAGGSDEVPPRKLDAAIIFASVCPLVPAALHALAKGGIVVCGGIHMSDIPSFPYADLWGERVITSVANLTRRDAEEFLEIAPRVPVQTKTETFPLEQANIALDRFRSGKLKGTAVLILNAN